MMSLMPFVPARRSALAASSASICRNEAPPCPAGGAWCRRTAAHESYRSICRSAATRDKDGDRGHAHIEGEHTALTESLGSRNSLTGFVIRAGGYTPTVARPGESAGNRKANLPRSEVGLAATLGRA